MKLIKYWIGLRTDKSIELSKYLSYLIEFEFKDPYVLKRCADLIAAINKGARFIVISVHEQNANSVITGIGIWQNPPTDPKYSNQYNWTMRSYLIPPDCFESSILSQLYKLIYNYLMNKENHGKDQDQLQGKANPDSGCYEGSILHCRRNRPQLTAGRHCDKAGFEIQDTRIGGSKIYLSSRHPEVLVTPRRDRVPERRPALCEGTPGGAGIQRDCSRVTSVGFPIPYGTLLTFCKSKEDCERVGDFYKSGDLFYVVTSVDTEKHLLIFQRIV